MENIFKYSNICMFLYLVSNKSCFMNTQANKNIENELYRLKVYSIIVKNFYSYFKNKFTRIYYLCN